MGEITQFKIYKADASLQNGNLRIRLFYPASPAPLEKRLPENLNFGIQVFQDLLQKGHAVLADDSNPMSPPNSGGLYLLKDGKIICHRRDCFAPTHRLFHSACAGHLQSIDDAYSAQSIFDNGLRELAEECLLITRENSPRLIVPKGIEKETITSARNIGIHLQPFYVNTTNIDPRDILEVYDEKGKLILKMKSFFDFIYEAQTSLNALNLWKIPLSSDDVFPISGERIMKDGKLIHLNLESYVLDLQQIQGKRFGTPLENPKVYKTEIKYGVPEISFPLYRPPFMGPENAMVMHPHLWAPENLLTRCLDALGVKGYDWIKMELWKEKSKLEGKTLLPPEVLAS